MDNNENNWKHGEQHSMREDRETTPAMNKALKWSLISISISVLVLALALGTAADESLTDAKLQFLALGIFIGLPVAVVYSVLAVLAAFKTPAEEGAVSHNRKTMKVVSIVSLLIPSVPLLGIFALCMYGLFNILTG